jgi:hypothetical protein
MKCLRLATAVALLTSGCASPLFPGPGAHEIGDGAAATERNGVRMIAGAAPAQDASEDFIPMSITVENRGSVPIRVDRHGFRLLSDTGRAYYPVPRPSSETLPEGVLAPGDSAAGLVYLEGPRPATQRLRLLADFENAETGFRLARLGIPFLTGP